MSAERLFMDTPKQQQDDNSMAIVANDLASLVDFYWSALQELQNIAEDIEGADDRLPYLTNLRLRLIECLQEMDGILNGGERAVVRAHSLAVALQHGIRFLGVDGEALMAQLRLTERLSEQELRQVTLGFIERTIQMLPGKLPAAQSVQGQREVLKAMRQWSSAAAKMNEDLAFLADRIRDL